MFDAIRNNRAIVQAILGLIVLTFAFFGIESYLRGIGNDGSIATVGGSKIGPAEFENALRRQQDQIRAQAKGEIDVAQLNTPEIREAVLEGLVNQRLLALYAEESQLRVSPAQLREVIGTIDEFKVDGQFSRDRYVQVLRSQGLTEPGFEAQLRRDIAFQQITVAVGNSAVSARNSIKALLALQLEQRKVATASVSAGAFADQVEVSDEEVKAYYEANSAHFRLPARAKAQYLVLDREQVGKRIAISEEATRKWYDEHHERYRQDEERRASHILLELPADAPADKVASTTAKAEEILSRVRENGGKDFAAIARKESQDPGSASSGGDLGFFGRGMMVKPFEDAVFALKEGEISAIVRSDFGLHIIQLTGIHPEKVKPFDEVRGAIEAELREQEVQREFALAAENFSNLVYEQPDSLAPAAEHFKLEIQASGWLSPGGEHPAPFDNPKLLEALFSSDSLERKLNTEAVDLGNGRLVSARILAYEPEKSRSLDEARSEIVSTLKRQGASRKAEQKGREILAELKKGAPVELKFSEPTVFTRAKADAAPGLLREVFSTSTAELPAYGGVAGSEGDFVVFRIDSAETPPIEDQDPRLGTVRSQYERLIGERDLHAFLAELRRKYGVEINRSALQAVAS